MVLHVAEGGEVLAAVGLGADVRLLASVGAQMGVEVAFLREGLGAACMWTDVRLRPSLAKGWKDGYVSPLVDPQSAETRVATTTGLTDVGLLAGVGQHVALQVPFGDEGLSALLLGTDERSFSRLHRYDSIHVSADVRFEVARLLEALPATRERTHVHSLALLLSCSRSQPPLTSL
jgi:hypothetical protein